MEIKGKIVLNQSNVLSDNILDFLTQYDIRKEKVHVCDVPHAIVFSVDDNIILPNNLIFKTMPINHITINEMKKCDYLFICDLNNIMRFCICYCDKRIMRMKKLNTI